MADQIPDNAARSGRRRVLRLGLAGATVFAPLPYASLWAQTAQGPRLLRLPKRALVIGNSRYPGSPLKNPANDARAIAATLQGMGFEVTSQFDAPRAAMTEAIKAYVADLARRKCVGLFYFAGHGVQLAWKNYLLPVDARVTSSADVQAQGVELNALMSGLSAAANPMNIVLLDACRDDPFGGAARPDQKGLSQMDAPLHTILGYATSPGNTASDGEGENGLYTENLLREMKVENARIEDVFKRVRLAVRRKSNGAQIPWESTSLEEDYYFVPPASLVAASEAEKAKQAEAEQQFWESIQEARAVAPFENYLRQYPSGQFSELAQLQLERLLAQQGEKPVQIAPSEGNPFTTGSARANTAYKVGDTYAFRRYDISSGRLKGHFANRVSAITDTEVLFNDGRSATDLLGNTTLFADGRRLKGSQALPLEYAVGKHWISRFNLTNNSGMQFQVEFEFRITAREKITVPAGTFNCFKIEGKGVSRRNFSNVTVTASNTFWMAPDQCRAAIRREVVRRVYTPRGIETLEDDRYELESFSQS